MRRNIIDLISKFHYAMVEHSSEFDKINITIELPIHDYFSAEQDLFSFSSQPIEKLEDGSIKFRYNANVFILKKQTPKWFSDFPNVPNTYGF